MKFHIIQVDETLDKILFLYDLNKDELMEENRHIKKWDKLIPGTKLKIPTISSTVDSEIMEMEPFVEDYYPKNNLENEVKNEKNEEKIVYQNVENEEKKDLILDENKQKELDDKQKKLDDKQKKLDERSIKNERKQIPYQNYRYYFINPRPNYVYPIYYYPIYYPIIKK